MRITRTVVLAIAALAALSAAAAALAAQFTYFGSLGAGDPAMAGSVAAADPNSDCAAPTAGSAGNATTRHFDRYRFRNTGAATICVTITVDARGCSQFIHSVTYIPSFNPASVLANYAADLGGAVNLTNSAQNYSVNVPANTMFDVIVYDATAGSYCTDYSLTVDGTTIVELPNTAVRFTSLRATRTRSGTVVNWGTASEEGTLGFNVYRGTGAHALKLNGHVIRALGGVTGRTYTWLDRGGTRATRYTVESVGANGVQLRRTVSVRR
jgi:hypothetical protein